MPEDDLRATIEAATTSLESATNVEGGAPAAPAASPAAPATPPTPAAAPASSPAPSPATGVAPAAPTPPGSIPPKDASAPAAPASPAAPGLPTDKAPGTWTPQARERWAEVHPDVRAEINRRERETSRAMTQSTQARQFQKEFDTAMQPFMGFIAAEKSNPIQATVNMMQSAALLRVGTPSQKASLAANIIKQYGIDLQMLDGLLAGQQANDPMEHIDRMIQQRTQPLVQRLQSFEQRDREAAQVLDQEVDHDLTTFAADPKNEFYNDVKDLMADILEVDMRRGGNMGLTEAYRAATLLSEPVRLTLEGRKTSQSAQRGHQIAQQARSGAISVKPSDETGVTSASQGDGSIRDSILYAMEKTSGR